jgi:hypothetical protein
MNLDFGHCRSAVRSGGRPSIAVLACDSGEAVSAIGGWIFDHVRFGWSVTVAAKRRGDDRCIGILGAHRRGLVDVLNSGETDGCPDVFAVSATLFSEDPRVRENVRRIARRQSATVLTWQWPQPDAPVGRRCRRDHRITRPANAFKLQALTAAGVDIADVSAVEVLEYFPVASAASQSPATGQGARVYRW